MEVITWQRNVSVLVHAAVLVTVKIMVVIVLANNHNLSFFNLS